MNFKHYNLSRDVLSKMFIPDLANEILSYTKNPYSKHRKRFLNEIRHFGKDNAVNKLKHKISLAKKKREKHELFLKGKAEYKLIFEHYAKKYGDKVIINYHGYGKDYKVFVFENIEDFNIHRQLNYYKQNL